MLESGKVDAVVCIANGKDGKWSSSEPILAKTPEDVMRGRGVKPALAPSLRVLDDIRNDKSIKKLLFCGVGCAVQGKDLFGM
jgi:coenzyme F420-reducing hydrogenase beta subunit